MANKFSKLGISKSLLSTLDSLGYSEMTPIQEASLPYILDGHDLIAKAETGSGKTAAFGIGIVERIDPKRFNIQAMVVCPTRELADQVAMELRRLAAYKPNTKIVTLCGGTPLNAQRISLQKGANIVVGTPGRLRDHMGKGTILLEHVEMLVLDEADRMLDLGFRDEVEKIISNLPKKRQTLLFSATFGDSVRSLSAGIQSDAKSVTVENRDNAEKREEYFISVDTAEKEEFLKEILSVNNAASTLIFCNTKADCDLLVDELRSSGINARELHGGLLQKERDLVLLMFANKSTPVIVATDLAARGLDIENVELVINYEIPMKSELYTHRIGRTARAGRSGTAVSFIAKRDKRYFDQLCGSRKCDVISRQEYRSLFPPSEKQRAEYRTLMIFAGKKKKLRKGDILGTLCKECGFDAKSIGRIDVTDQFSYVALPGETAEKAVRFFKNGKIKGRRFKALLLE